MRLVTMDICIYDIISCHRRAQNFTMEGITIQPKTRTATNKAVMTHLQCRCTVSLIFNWK